VARGFKVNKRGIEAFTRALQKEFDKRPVSVPVNLDEPEVLKSLPATSINNYHGPVINGDVNGAQLAWGNEHVSQNQDNSTKTIAAGYESLADAVVALLQKLPEIGLDSDSTCDVTDSSNEILEEVTSEAPEPKRIRRALHVLKGVLAPLSKGIAAGVTAAVEPEVQEWATKAIGDLSQFLT
jgi:hypothetical protein